MIDRIICWIFGHKWYFVGRTGETEYGSDYNPGTEVYACSRCGKSHCEGEKELK